VGLLARPAQRERCTRTGPATGRGGDRVGRSSSWASPGIGKTALIDGAVASAQAFRVLRSMGNEAEMELPFAALQRLCAPIRDRLADLPGPQSNA